MLFKEAGYSRKESIKAHTDVYGKTPGSGTVANLAKELASLHKSNNAANLDDNTDLYASRPSSVLVGYKQQVSNQKKMNQDKQPESQSEKESNVASFKTKK